MSPKKSINKLGGGLKNDLRRLKLIKNKLFASRMCFCYIFWVELSWVEFFVCINVFFYRIKDCMSSLIAHIILIVISFIIYYFFLFFSAISIFFIYRCELYILRERERKFMVILARRKIERERRKVFCSFLLYI